MGKGIDQDLLDKVKAVAKGPEADLLRDFVDLLYCRNKEVDTKHLSPKEQAASEGQKALRRSSTAEAEYESITRGDRAYQSPEFTKKLFKQYPFIETFLSNNDYLNVREFTVFISHYPKSGRKPKIISFVKTPGKNTLKRLEKPAQLQFSIDAAIKQFPVLKPLSKLISPHPLHYYRRRD